MVASIHGCTVALARGARIELFGPLSVFILIGGSPESELQRADEGASSTQCTGEP